jgi:hypothetical protein
MRDTDFLWKNTCPYALPSIERSKKKKTSSSVFVAKSVVKIFYGRSKKFTFFAICLAYDMTIFRDHSSLNGELLDVSFPLPDMFHQHQARTSLFFPTQIHQLRGFRHIVNKPS